MIRERVREPLLRLRHRGDRYYCTCCDSSLRDMATLSRENRMCWVCGSLERHRLITMLFDQRPDMLAPGVKILHVAPEPSLLRHILEVPDVHHIGGDLNRDFSDIRIDVTALQFADESFDAVICNHVLEHVPDDRRAMQEIHRVLKPGGWALLLVPDVVEQGDHTFEDLTVTDPAERERLFGQHDHVRVYGWDYADRLTTCGFHVEIIRMENVLDEATIERHRLRKFGVVEAMHLATRGA